MQLQAEREMVRVEPVTGAFRGELELEFENLELNEEINKLLLE
jgi:hypothetical protein